MVSRNIIGLFLIAPALFAVPLLPAQSVHSQLDRSAHFSSYRTYSWTVPAEDTPDGEIVRDAMNKSLAALGLRLVPSGGDVQVTATIGARAKGQHASPGFNSDYLNRSVGGFAGFYEIPGVLTKSKELKVTLIDARTAASLWVADARWTSSRAANDPRRDLEDRKLEQVVGKFFQKLSKAQRGSVRS